MEIREIQRPARSTETFSEFPRDKNQWEVTVCHNWPIRIDQSANGKRRFCGTRVVSGKIDQFELTCSICRLANPVRQPDLTNGSRPETHLFKQIPLCPPHPNQSTPLPAQHPLGWQCLCQGTAVSRLPLFLHTHRYPPLCRC